MGLRSPTAADGVCTYAMRSLMHSASATGAPGRQRLRPAPVKSQSWLTDGCVPFIQSFWAAPSAQLQAVQYTTRLRPSSGSSATRMAGSAAARYSTSSASVPTRRPPARRRSGNACSRRRGRGGSAPRGAPAGPFGAQAGCAARVSTCGLASADNHPCTILPCMTHPGPIHLCTIHPCTMHSCACARARRGRPPGHARSTARSQTACARAARGGARTRSPARPRRGARLGAGTGSGLHTRCAARVAAQQVRMRRAQMQAQWCHTPRLGPASTGCLEVVSCMWRDAGKAGCRAMGRRRLRR